MTNAKFKELNADCNLESWLKENQNTSPSLSFVNSIVKTFMKERNAKTSHIPHILSSPAREYGIQLPVVEGITTEKYWEDKMNKASVMTP